MIAVGMGTPPHWDCPIPRGVIAVGLIYAAYCCIYCCECAPAGAQNGSGNGCFFGSGNGCFFGSETDAFLAPETDAFFHRSGAHPSRPNGNTMTAGRVHTITLQKTQSTVGINLIQLMHTITLQNPN